MMQPDLGTSLVLLAILGGMLFMSGASLRWLGAIVGARACVAAADLDLRPARLPEGSGSSASSTRDRHPGRRATSSTSRRSRSGSGGLFGKGLTNGTQNQLNFLPVQESDFVAAIYLEELGFVGAILLLDPLRGAAVADPGRRLAVEATRSG